MPRIYVTDYFLKQVRRMRKYRHLADDVTDVLESFTPDQGRSLGEGLFKARFRSRDVAKGKSGSFRILILLLKVSDVLTPVTLYFKGDIEDMGEQEIEYHLKMVYMELKGKRIL